MTAYFIATVSRFRFNSNRTYASGDSNGIIHKWVAIVSGPRKEICVAIPMASIQETCMAIPAALPQNIGARG